MSQLSRNPNVVQAESDVGFADLDHVPLTRRRRLLLSCDRAHGVAQPATATAPPSKIDDAMKREDYCCDQLELCAEQNVHNVVSSGIDPEPVGSESSESIEIGWSQDIGEPGNSKAQNSLLASTSAEGVSNGVGKAEERIGDDDLEHITLKERRRMLLGRMTLRLAEPPMEGNSKGSSEGHGKSNSKKIAEISCENGIASFAGSQFSGILEKNESIFCENSSIGSVSGSQFSETLERSDSVVRKQLPYASSSGSVSEFSSINYKYSTVASNCYAAATKKPRISVEKAKTNSVPVHASDIHFSTSENYVQVKMEPLDGCPMQNIDGKSSGNFCFEQVQVKREVEAPQEVYENNLDCTKWRYRMNLLTSAQNPSISDEQAQVKKEAETAHEVDDEELDHMKLSDRMKLPTFAQNPFISCSSGEDLNSTSEFSSFTSDYVKPLRMHRPWKRKKTATDSVETALEEDAPGLLQVLLKQGVFANEIKLYGETECGDALNESLIKESFSGLEAVISKLFFKRETCVKLLSVRCTKGSRPSYCLTCLLSLVEQARYLQFRKWPVEWGWCRELQSFIFVFQRHKRIVMERPEYGYATYFFELVDTSPIHWQIRRLVTAMKLTSCGRITLIENKPLLVGEDLTEGEAHVLMEYGWVPNTGLGTMLNYCDRVVHDRKSEKDSSEWRSKICKLLVDGYTNGIIISTMIAGTETGADFRDAGNGDSSKVKVELC